MNLIFFNASLCFFPSLLLCNYSVITFVLCLHCVLVVQYNLSIVLYSQNSESIINQSVFRALYSEIRRLFGCLVSLQFDGISWHRRIYLKKMTKSDRNRDVILSNDFWKDSSPFLDPFFFRGSNTSSVNIQTLKTVKQIRRQQRWKMCFSLLFWSKLLCAMWA